MAQNSYALKIDSIIIQKFGSMVGGSRTTANLEDSIDITLQAHEVSIFENLFSPVIRCEIAVVDFIGLFVNFPMSGEEIITIKYSTIADGATPVTLYFVTDAVKNVNMGDDGRSVGFVLCGVAIEAWANAKQKVQQAYENSTLPQTAKKVFEEHIDKRTKKFFPRYLAPTFITDDNDTKPCTFVIPNLSPFSAMSLLGDLAVNVVNDKNYTYLFYQTMTGFNFRTLQGLFTGRNARDAAKRYSYIYLSDEINTSDSRLKNDGRVVSNLVNNRRFGTLQKLSGGYFHNILFEINIAQKAVWGEDTKIEEINTLYDNKLNTEVYTNLAYVEGNSEESNRTKYVVTTQRENDDQFPLSRSRDRWGKDMMSKSAMSQIDYTVTIPGTNRFKAGSLFHLEIPEMHGFEILKRDDFVSGLFMVTEVKHILTMGGYHTTVLRLNKDSYGDTIDRPSRYK